MGSLLKKITLKYLKYMRQKLNVHFSVKAVKTKLHKILGDTLSLQIHAVQTLYFLKILKKTFFFNMKKCYNYLKLKNEKILVALPLFCMNPLIFLQVVFEISF